MRKQLTCLLLLFIACQLQAQVGIGTATPHATAQLEISSNNKGLLIPRLTESQRNAIVTPAVGLLVFQTDGAMGLYYYTGSAWQQLSASWYVNGNTGNTSSHFLGTTDGQPLVFRVGNILAGQIKAGGSHLSFGYLALQHNTGSDNTAFGSFSMENNLAGSWNTALGKAALKYNTAGSYNTATGRDALHYNTVGMNNTATGYQALYHNATGFYNTAVGTNVLFNNKVNGNTGVGSHALYNNGNGTANTAVGFEALYNNTTRGQNTAVGSSTLKFNTTGQGLTGIGANALNTNTEGSYNTAIGVDADVTENKLTNATAIGYGAKVDASNKVVIGNTNVTSIGGQVDWTTFSDGRFKEDVQEDVPGLHFIKSLRPVTYTVNKGKLASHFGKGHAAGGEGEAAKNATAKRETGFIAQEVEKAAKGLGYNFNGVDVPTNGSALYGIRYSAFIMPLVKAVQEQQALIETLQKEKDVYKEQLRALEERLEKLEKLMDK